jgi:uncharacterized protein (DUF2141 family)
MSRVSRSSRIRRSASNVEPLEGRQLLSTTLTVSASAAVFAAGGSSLPHGATLPPEYVLSSPATAGSVLTFAGVTGKITVNEGTGTNENDPDGVGSIGAPLRVGSFNGISGISDNEDGILCGVFLNSSAPTGTPPTSLAFSSTGAAGTINTDFTSLSPKLDQTFFIGDGLTGDGKGTVQKFNVPAGATRLYLGIADAPAYQGSPGAYQDNVGSFKATFTVTEPAAKPATISGTVFADTNGNGKRDSGENGLAGVTVYIDSNKSGKYVTGDPKAVTSSSGAFTFAGLSAGTYVIREEVPAGDTLTTPSAGDFNVTVAAGKSATGYTFGDAPATGTISGTVFNDSNGDGKQDDGELGLGDYTVFIDLKGTGTYASGDPTFVTGQSGAWSFTGLKAGTYRIVVEPYSGATATTPKVLTITLKAGGKSTGNVFGEKAIG